MQKEVDENKSETGSLCGSTRSRRTLKTEFAAPPSSTKYIKSNYFTWNWISKCYPSFRTSARKPRKPKSDCEEVAHPAHLSAPPLEEVDNSLETSTLGSSKRRLYNARCPEILLPSSTKVKEKIYIETKRVLITILLVFWRRKLMDWIFQSGWPHVAVSRNACWRGFLTNFKYPIISKFFWYAVM